MGSRVPLRIDALKGSKRDPVLAQTEIGAIDELAAFDRKLREVRVIDDDRGVRGEEQQADPDHGRVAGARAEDEDGEPRDRKERVRGPKQREIRADVAHERSLGIDRADREPALDVVEGAAHAHVVGRGGDPLTIELVQRAEGIADR